MSGSQEKQRIETGADMRRVRVGAVERRKGILLAAARVFERTGDLGSATTKMIAEEAGVNESILYRHFASKDEIFYGAVVEPLRVPLEEFIAHAGTSVMSLSRAERVAFFGQILHEMVVKLSAELPALGLVLFGGPEVSRKFYETTWDPALQRLAEDWTNIFESVGHTDYNDPYLSAQVVVGSCLALALARRHGGVPDEEALARESERCGEIARMMYEGVFKFAD